MRILVCGSRHFHDYDKLYSEINGILFDKGNYEDYAMVSCIISGHAKGADTLGEQYAKNNNIPLEIYPADWNKHGKAAGPIRNKQMLDEGKPDLVIAFMAKDSRGTKNMVNQATKAGVEVKVIDI